LNTRNTGSKHYFIYQLIFFFLVLFLVQAIAACSTNPQGSSPPATQVASSTQPAQASATQPAQTPGDPSPTATTTPPSLVGPTNFLLATPLNFSSVNGATMDDSGAVTPLDTNTVETEVTGELERLLFVVDSSDNVKVYSPGVAPVAAQLKFNTDGSTAIFYTQTVDSEAGTIAITFAGVLLKDQIRVDYQQQYTPSMLINALASDVEVSFTTHVKWVAANQIPAAPSNGTYHITSQGGIALSWSAGQNAVSYNVYRLISDQDEEFQLLATVRGTSYIDNSKDAIQNINSIKGITYAIFSVGPTGVENPGGIVISIS